MLVGTRPLGVGDGHVIGNEDDRVPGRPQIGKLDNAGNLDAAVGHVHPEVGRDGGFQLEDQTCDPDILDPVIEPLWTDRAEREPGARQAPSGPSKSPRQSPPRSVD